MPNWSGLMADGDNTSGTAAGLRMTGPRGEREPDDVAASRQHDHVSRPVLPRWGVSGDLPLQ
jgi:hypothetical protein